MKEILQKPFGEDRSFEEIIQNQKSLVIFLRHPGWPACRAFLAQLREHYNQLTAGGVQLIAITPSNRSLVERFIKEFGPYPFDIYGDPERSFYKKMGHKSMAKWKLLAKAGKAFLKGGKKSFLPENEARRQVVKESLNTQDIYIQGGSWIFDETGKVVWKHIDESPEKHAKIGELLKQVK